MLEEGKRPSVGLKISCIAIITIMLAIGFASIVPVVEEGDGWYTTTRSGTSAYTNYENGYVRSVSGSHYLYRNRYGPSGITGTNTYKFFMRISLPTFDEKAYVNSATLNLRCYNYYGTQTHYAYILGNEDTMSFDAEDIALGAIGNPQIGSVSVTSTGTFSISFSSTALYRIRNYIANEMDYVYIMISGDGTSNYNHFYGYYSSIIFEYDQHAPNTPYITNNLPTFTSNDHVSLSRNSVSDRPSPGYGGVIYQFGVFDSSSNNEPMFTSHWTTSYSHSFDNLVDGKQYFFRVRAKDGLGFESSWSSYKYTMIDTMAPSIPSVHAEPLYTNSTENTISWDASTDSSSGVSDYVVRIATDPEFTDETTYITGSTEYTFPDLVSGTTYYYSVEARDNVGRVSSKSAVVHSMQDDTEPSVPIMMREPPFTKGTMNRFEWHASKDIGIGVSNYSYEVATSDDFNPGSVVDSGVVNGTYFETDSLMDGTRYFARVKAVDGFGYESDWSNAEWSIMDQSGPGEIGLSSLMTYSQDAPIKLEWNAAEDDGSGTGWYKVQWSTSPTFTANVNEIDHVVGHSYTISGLDVGETWYFRVISFDGLGNEGENETVLTTIDAEPPTTPVFTPLSEYTGGRSCDLDWSESTDELSGLDHYILNVYTSQERIGQVFNVHTSETSYEVPGLSDGTTYYYEVIAMDRAGNEIASAIIHSMQDARGPDAPILKNIAGVFSTTGLVPIEWEPAVDEGMGGVTYEVHYASDPLFTIGVRSFTTDSTSDTLHFIADTRAETYTPLADGTYFYKVRALDSFGTPSSFSPTMKVIVDTEDPDIPLLNKVERYWGGGKAIVTWDEGEEELHYIANVYDNETAELPVRTSGIIEGTDYEIYGLEPGMEYWIKVKAIDMSGRMSEESVSVSVFMDNTPPRLTIDKDGIFGGTDLYISGEAEDNQCGMGQVQISFNQGLSWTNCRMDDEIWSFSIPNAPEGADHFMIRAVDAGGNIGDSVIGYIDMASPSVQITYPAEGSEVSGVVQLMGTIHDPNLNNYKVEYKAASGGDWNEILPMQTTSGFSGVLATWVTSGLSGGEYTIRVTAEDHLGQTVTEEIELKISGSSISLDPSMVAFSNSHPVSGDKVTVYLTLTNLGDSPAEGLVVTLYDGDEPIGTTNDVSVPAKGTTVVTGEVSASGTHEITAKITGDTTGEIVMADAAVLETTEDEMMMENFGGILALIALILAIIAIVLVIFFGILKKDKKEEKEKEEAPEAEIREEPKDEGTKAPALSAPAGGPLTPELPSQTQQQPEQPALPQATTPPPAPAAPPQPAPQQTVAPVQQAPQPAPAPAQQVPVQQAPQPATPPVQQAAQPQVSLPNQ